MKENCSNDIQRMIETQTLNVNVHHIRIINSEGIVLYSTSTKEINKNINHVAPRHLKPIFMNDRERIIKLTEDSHAFTALSVIKNEPSCQKCHGTKPIIAFLDVDTHLTPSEQNFYTGISHFIFLGIVVIIVLGYGLLMIFNSFINKPLHQMTNAINQLERGDFNLQLPVKHNDEFGTINKHFNRMVHELDNSRKKIEELHIDQLRRADKMVTLGEIAAAMAHDINNHSAVIMTRADYLQMKTESDQSMKDINEELNVINDQVHKISKTTSYILKNAKRISADFNNFNLSSLVDTVVQNFEPLLKDKNLSIKANLNAKQQIIHGNSEQIEQVIMNLLNNSVDATKEGGKIEIEVSKNEEEEVQLSISDNGKGISSKDKEKIFSPFFTTKANEKGTGLGLYIIKNICKNHNAVIDCESKLGEGAKFIITFKIDKDN
ncbi:MAG: HAMP domain-containing sensor histidine kinase [Bacteroidota bacterium]